LKSFVFRNSTVENLFKSFSYDYSGYGDISFIPQNYSHFMWFYLPDIKFNNQEITDEVNDIKSKFDFVYGQLPSNSVIHIFTIPLLFYIRYEISDDRVSHSITELNNYFYEKAYDDNRIKIIPFHDFATEHKEQIIDWRFFYIAQNIISPKLVSKFQPWYLKTLDVINSKRKKCLVLDLDNTLWGGILGEDGQEGIKIGNTYPGNVYAHFQNALLEISKKGIILAVCSKNNENDVITLWESHPSLILRQNHFSAYRINWIDKATNIQEIAEELNIGLDSIVFIDDNPAERERVKQMVPMVEVPDFPVNVYELPIFIKKVYEEYFQSYQLTKEDINKTSQYLANSERSVHKKQFSNLEDYYLSLEMDLTIKEADDFSIARLSQMTQKTNQFNLTTKRYTESDLRNLIANGAMVTYMALKDKFGDNGISAMCIMQTENDEIIIDSFLLSCRILGREVEKVYLYYLLNKLFDQNKHKIKAHYIPSSKNIQTIDFYEKLGLTLLNTNSLGIKEYELVMTEKFEIKKHYKLN
jgi:FkbH-like protein